MTHDDRCEYARGKVCTCECGGKLHGTKANEKDEFGNKVYYLCEYEFVPYPNKDSQKALGADAYAHIPWKAQKKYKEADHALAIWKNLVTGEFEVIKEYFHNAIIPVEFGDVKAIMQTTFNRHYVIYFASKNYQTVLGQITILRFKYWGFSERWVACPHDKNIKWCLKVRQDER